jgi:hypothetical protein
VTHDPHIVIELPTGQLVAQRVQYGTDLADLEDLWLDAWQDFGPTKNEKIRVGLGWGFLAVGSGSNHDAVARLKTSWLGYRDAVLPPREDDDEDEQVGDVDEAEHLADGPIDPDTFMSPYLVDRAADARAAHEAAAELEAKQGRTRTTARKTAVEAKEARLKVGRILLEVRADHGGPERGPGAKWWGAFLLHAGIPRTSARRYMKAAEVSASGRNPKSEPFHILVDSGKYKKSVKKLSAHWPAEGRGALPGLLRDLADDIEAELTAGAVDTAEAA